MASVYNFTKLKILLAVHAIEQKHNSATVAAIHIATGLSRKKIQASVPGYVKYKYLKKYDVDPDKCSGSRFAYKLTPFGYEQLLKINYRYQKGLSLNLRKTPVHIEKYEVSTKKEQTNYSRVEEVTEEATRAIVPAIAKLAAAHSSGEGMQQVHFSELRAQLRPVIEKAIATGL